jgi:hypothetical protein
MSQGKQLAIGVTLAGLFILAASFMSWGGLRGPIDIKLPFGENTGITSYSVVLTSTAWKSNLILSGLKLPNWLTVLAAAMLVAICWLKVNGAWEAPLWVCLLLAAYGFAHAALFTVMLKASDQGTVGIGSIFTMIGFLAAFVALVRGHRRSQAVPNTVAAQ